LAYIVVHHSDKPILSLTDYFYEKKGGSGIYIYHVEVGVALFNKAVSFFADTEVDYMGSKGF
jgi:hypothetical protein